MTDTSLVEIEKRFGPIRSRYSDMQIRDIIDSCLQDLQDSPYYGNVYDCVTEHFDSDPEYQGRTISDLPSTQVGIANTIIGLVLASACNLVISNPLLSYSTAQFINGVLEQTVANFVNFAGLKEYPQQEIVFKIAFHNFKENRFSREDIEFQLNSEGKSLKIEQIHDACRALTEDYYFRMTDDNTYTLGDKVLSLKGCIINMSESFLMSAFNDYLKN